MSKMAFKWRVLNRLDCDQPWKLPNSQADVESRSACARFVRLCVCVGVLVRVRVRVHVG